MGGGGRGGATSGGSKNYLRDKICAYFYFYKFFMHLAARKCDVNGIFLFKSYAKIWLLEIGIKR